MTSLKKINSSIVDSKWLVECEWRIKNKTWIDLTQKIAIKILSTLRSENITKKELSIISGVSIKTINLIVKGNYPLSIKEISLLESSLKINLI